MEVGRYRFRWVSEAGVGCLGSWALFCGAGWATPAGKPVAPGR